MPESPPSPPPPGGYRLVRLRVQNVKRVSFLDFTPEGNLVVVAGRNNAGKSSVLDSIMWGLGGGRTFTDVERPIRDGAKKGRIELDIENRLTLGRYHVVRTFTPKGTTLTVEDDNGPVRDQQAVLSALIGEHSFDPFAFMRLPKRQQRATLLSVVDLDVDLDELAAKRDAVYAERTIVGRTRDALDARLAAMPMPAEGLPDEEVPAEEVVAELRAAREATDANRQLRNRVINLEGDIEESEAKVERIESDIAELEERIAKLREERKAIATQQGVLEEELAMAKAAAEGLVDPDVDAIEQRLTSLDALNRRVRAARDRKVLAADHLAAKDAYDAHTRTIESIDEEKIAALERAPMPIPGLSFDDDGLYYAAKPDARPVPVGQCSDSEQLRISVAIAVALNPALRLARIKEGALLDSSSLRLLRDLADEHNFQVWVEMVAEEAGEDDWLMIEDGAEAGAGEGGSDDPAT